MEHILTLINTRIAAAADTDNITEKIFMESIKNEVERIINQRDSYLSALKSALETNDVLIKKLSEYEGIDTDEQ